MCSGMRGTGAAVQPFHEYWLEVALAGAQQSPVDIQLLQYAVEKRVLCQLRQIIFEQKMIWDEKGRGVEGESPKSSVIPAKERHPGG